MPPVRAPVRHLGHLEAGLTQQLLGRHRHLLPVLERAGGVIGEPRLCALRSRQRSEPREIFRDVQRPLRHRPRAIPPLWIVAEDITVILDDGAAAGCGDDDRVQPLARDLAVPGIDRRLRAFVSGLFKPHVMRERAAAARAFRDHDLDAEPVEQADRRLVDLRPQNRLRAAGQDRDPPPLRALSRKDARQVGRAWGCRPVLRKPHHGAQALRQPAMRPQPAREGGAGQGQPPVLFR